MPWRDAPTPYAVWVSEMMLQQTQVATVMPYFARFVERFPDVAALAAAGEQDVLKAWEGLGYYARARNLHRAARIVMRDLGGRIPTDAAALGRLPGIGDYASAAIASIAYGEPVPAVDGNVLRVMARLRGSAADITRPATRRAVYADLLPLIRRVNPNDFNQSLMELGALVCRPRQPRCADCPLARACVARRLGRTAELPVKSRPGPGPHHHAVAAVICRGRRVLLARRPARGLLGGLWEFPQGRCAAGEAPALAVARVARAETGLTVDAGDALPPVRHAFSHFRLTVHGFRCRAEGGRLLAGAEYAELRWVDAAAMATLPLTKVARDVARHVPSARAARGALAARTDVRAALADH
jgi:A/G-specific adenine glycosylase